MKSLRVESTALLLSREPVFESFASHFLLVMKLMAIDQLTKLKLVFAKLLLLLLLLFEWTTLLE